MQIKLKLSAWAKCYNAFSVRLRDSLETIHYLLLARGGGAGGDKNKDHMIFRGHGGGNKSLQRIKGEDKKTDFQLQSNLY